MASSSSIHKNDSSSSKQAAFVSLDDLYDTRLNEDMRGILNKHGFDQPLLKYYWRRAMLANDPTRMVPGGPDGHHH
ncbi:hypothetical protein E3N88_41425 [Mikania micrantha]|uniref:Uncharacterized protein n=1 Tax=Mikania micrantha TaxID=192012 RepID=A0A5N6LSN6_9ASTR|nr:hypothetical protein E3N88_41425 [Mikania micrantha]